MQTRDKQRIVIGPRQGVRQRDVAPTLRFVRNTKTTNDAYHPSANGRVERSHRTLNSIIAKLVKENQRNWHEVLDLATAAYNASPNDSTQYSPNFLMYGRETMTPFDLIISSPSQFSVKTTNEYVAGLKDTLSTAYEAVRSNTRVAAERQKKQYDTKVRPAEFAVGKLVWVYYPRAWKRRSPKWSNNYVGPCLVERRMNAVNYVVKRTPKSKLWVVHVDKLKPFVGEWPSIWREFEQEVTELPIERHTMHCSDSKPSASGA